MNQLCPVRRYELAPSDSFSKCSVKGYDPLEVSILSVTAQSLGKLQCPLHPSPSQLPLAHRNEGLEKPKRRNRGNSASRETCGIYRQGWRWPFSSPAWPLLFSSCKDSKTCWRTRSQRENLWEGASSLSLCAFLSPVPTLTQSVLPKILHLGNQRVSSKMTLMNPNKSSGT